MKKITTIFSLAALCCTTVFGQSATPQGELKDIVTITQKEIKTNTLYDDNLMSLTMVPYEGDELRSGLIYTKIGFLCDNVQGLELKETVNPLVEISFTDPYERKPFYIRNTELIPSLYKAMKRSDYESKDYIQASTIVRGGQYVYRTSIPCMDYYYEKEVEITDEPTVRLQADKMKVGKDIDLRIHYNTGYPYDPTQYTGNEKATMHLFSLGKDDQGHDTETEIAMAQKTLRLHRPDQPLVAAIDVLQLGYVDPEPGAYRVKTTSDLTHKNANRDDIYFIVSDTLRATTTMEKMSYEVGKDKGLKVHMKMNFGFPYIKASSGDDVPTVHVMTHVVIPGESGALVSNVTLLKSTTPITEGVSSEHPLNWEGDIVTAALEDQEEAPLEEKRMELHVVVSFNDEVQYNTIIPFLYVPQTAPSSISRPNVTANGQEPTANDQYYDLQGRQIVNSDLSNHQLSNGLYIHQGRKVVVK